MTTRPASDPRIGPGLARTTESRLCRIARRAGALLPLALLLWTCERGARPAQSPQAPAERAPQTEDECLDRVLEEAGLNRFGDPPGTMYAGGTPLFDETTGRVTSRREYVAKRHPDLVSRCPQMTEPRQPGP